MPESKGRSKAAYTPPPRSSKAPTANPAWFQPLMVGLLLVGLVWVVTFYIAQGAYPIPNIGYWNLGIGFGLLLSGFVMTTRWR